MATFRLTTELPIPADTAFALAQKLELFAFVVAPVMKARGFAMPDGLAPGVEGAARLWWFWVIPSWTHHLRLTEVGDRVLQTEEHGGPARTWNHRLTFERLTETSCRYTDEIELEDGLLGRGTWLFAALLFRWRHHRWRVLARVLA